MYTNRIKEFLQKDWQLKMIVLVAAIAFGLVSFVNHYCFRTYALDLGAYTNASYLYAHFILANNDVFMPEYQPMLGGHFDLYLLLFSPLTYLLGGYTLLIVQWIAVLLGGIGIYKLFRNSNYKSNICFYATAYFYSFYGVFSALSFDYHSVVVAASAVPWFFLFVRKNQLISAAVIFTFCLIAQENVALGLAFISSGLAWYFRKEKKKAILLLLLTAWSICYFLVVLKVVIPFFNPSNSYTGFHYSVMGDSITSFIFHLFQNPIRSMNLLFINHSKDHFFDGIKIETWLMLCFSGGFLLLRKPIYLWMIIPLLFQKLYHDYPIMWSVNYQYSIEFAPILTIGIFDVISSFKKEKLKIYSAFVAIFLALACTIRLMDNTIIKYDKTNLRIYKSAHFNREFSIPKAYELLSKIPKNASVSAQSAFVPHLSCREKIYQFPLINDAQYILLSPKDNHYPLDSARYFDILNGLKSSVSWTIMEGDENFILFKRK
jgi:uncharacterized membrane protein